MHRFLAITVAGLVVTLAAGPALAQGGAAPKQEQQAPRDSGSSSGQSGPNQPGTTNPGTTDTTQDPTKGGAVRPENMPRGIMRDSGTSGSSSSGTMSRDSGATGSGSAATSDHGRGMKGTKASNSQVRQVQEALKAQGHDPGPIDGVMGPQTQDALRAYQRSQNLTETGRLDAETSAKLGVSAGSSGTSSGSRSDTKSR